MMTSIEEFESDAYRDGYRTGYSAGVTATFNPKLKWISIKDRLPEKDQTVLIYVTTHPVGFMTGIMRDNEISWPENAYFPPEYRASNKISHWMPLPESPEC